MSEIADAFAAQGLPDGFHRASAEVYERLESFADRASAPTIEDLVRAVRTGGPPRADS
jgi:hypothetical protein